MDEYSNSMPPQYHSQPMASWYPMEAYSEDAAYTLEDRSHPGDLASFTRTQFHPSYTMDVYPSLPINAERMLEYHLPHGLPSLPPTNGFPAAGPPDSERIDSDVQYEVEDVEYVESDPEDAESAPEDTDSDSDSEPEPEDYSLPADATRWISMSPTQFDREYPGGNPFVIEELSPTSEEDPEYVELGASALHRIFVIFWATEQAIFPYTSKDIYREIIWGVMADLLRDGKFWRLWVDGDEEKCADLHRDGYPSKTSFEYVKRKLSCSCLRLRKSSLSTWSSFCERISKLSFAMRVSAITWATLTSVCVREARWVRGLADWTRCELHNAVREWYYVLWKLDNPLGDEDRRSHLEVAFKDTLRCHGHSCYSSISNYFEFEKPCWLFLQSFLPTSPSGRDVSIILIDDSSCRQCTKLKELYIANNNAHHIPPPSLLVLNDLRLILDIDMAAWHSILALGASCGMISVAILTKMDDKIQMLLDTDEFDFEYQPWVNRLPCSLRSSVMACSESEWREAGHAVRRESQHESVTPSRWDSLDIGLGVRITAIYLLMSERSPQKLTPRKYWLDFSDRYKWREPFDEPVYPPHIAASVEAFCNVTSESSDVSTHTCCEFTWHNCKLGLRQCYAAAYLLLHPESQDVPLLEPLRRPVYCPGRWYESSHPIKNCGVCSNCTKCQRLPEAEPLVPTRITAPDGTIPLADGTMTDDIVPTLAVVRRNSPVSTTVTQRPSTSSQSHGSTLPKDVILPQLKTHFSELLAQYDIPVQYTNLGAPQLPWCTLPQLLRDRHLEIVGWPQQLPLPDATGKHNAKGIMGLTAKDARRLYAALPDISFRPIDKARARPREEESEDDIVGNRPTKKVKGKGKAPEQGEKKFRVTDVQMVIPGIRIGKSN